MIGEAASRWNITSRHIGDLVTASDACAHRKPPEQAARYPPGPSPTARIWSSRDPLGAIRPQVRAGPVAPVAAGGLSAARFLGKRARDGARGPIAPPISHRNGEGQRALGAESLPRPPGTGAPASAMPQIMTIRTVGGSLRRTQRTAGQGLEKNPWPAQQARDCKRMVAGAGFEPTTSGL